MNEKYKLDPNWVTDFTDAEGCFYVRIYIKDINQKKWIVQVYFQLELHVKNKDLLYQIKSFFCNVGKMYNKITSVNYQIRTVNEITKVIIPHLEKYLLKLKNKMILFCSKRIVELINKKEHLNKEGLAEILKLKAYLNKGLTKDLSIYLPNIRVIKNTAIYIPNKINYNWTAVFLLVKRIFL